MTCIKRPSDVFPDRLLAEFRRLAALPGPWMVLKPLEYPVFQPVLYHDSWLEEVIYKRGDQQAGAEAAAMIACLEWVRSGPKIVRVSEEHYQALARVDVRLEPADLALPYETVLVELPPSKTFQAVIVHRAANGYVIWQALTEGHADDVCTTMSHRPGLLVETVLANFDSTVEHMADAVHSGLRVATNMLLAMTNFGFQSRLIFPAERDRDVRLAAEDSERGRKAAARLREAPVEVSFDRDVRLCHREGGAGEAGDPTGRELPCQWRRGHWKMQAHGPQHGLRKRIFVAPYMVRADLLAGDAADMVTAYRG